ncbi:MAG: hypothetical protein Q8880_02570 [Bacteroidota bacterium]|nr:hypothetical protein [Bacteroidota bacterium]
MDIIVLVGPGSCGKTTTINFVYNMLIDQGAISTNRQPEGTNPLDFSDVLDWKGKKIAFLSMGDYSYRIIDLIRENDNLNCDLFICACNDRFVRPFDEFAKYNNNQITKTIANEEVLMVQANNVDANQIFSLI